MSKRTTYLITGADTPLGYTLTCLLASESNNFILALCNSDIKTWRRLHSGKEDTPSYIQTLHIDSWCSLDDAADRVAQKYHRKIDVVIACPDASDDARVVVSRMDRVMHTDTKVAILQTEIKDWCRNLVQRMDQTSKIVTLGVEIGVLEKAEMKARAASVLSLVNVLTKKEGSGSVVRWVGQSKLGCSKRLLQCWEIL